MKLISDFEVGEIYLMNPVSRSHSKKPYYIYIKSITQEYIETSIPFFHSLKIGRKSDMWYYHTNRMERRGHIKFNSNLLYFQKNLIPFSLKEKIVNFIYQL